MCRPTCAAGPFNPRERCLGLHTVEAQCQPCIPAWHGLQDCSCRSVGESQIEHQLRWPTGVNSYLFLGNETPGPQSRALDLAPTLRDSDSIPSSVSSQAASQALRAWPNFAKQSLAAQSEAIIAHSERLLLTSADMLDGKRVAKSNRHSGKPL